MSDPVTNVEIEDVLSSIRRLVSEDARAGHPDHVQDRAPVRPPEALVLTQEHRVSNEPEPKAEVSETARSIVKSSTRLELERAIAELEAAVGLEEEAEAAASAGPALEAVADVELATVDETAEDDIDWEAPIGRAVEGEPPASVELDAEAEPEAEAVSETAEVEEASQLDQTLSETADEAADEPEAVAEFEPVETEAADNAPEIADADEASVEDAEAFFAQSDADVADHSEEPDEAEVEISSAPEVETENTDDVAQPYVEAETAVQDDPIVTPFLRQRRAPVEQDDLDDVSFVPDDIEDTSAMSGDPFDDAEFLDDDSLDPFSEQVIDEAMLRDMVADIVRQELQGELGERITRNVRKLVRREINRALAGQDFI